jgi:hypothetical protein
LYIYASYIFNECTSFVISHVCSMIPKWIQHRFLLPPKVAINNDALFIHAIKSELHSLYMWNSSYLNYNWTSFPVQRKWTFMISPSELPFALIFYLNFIYFSPFLADLTGAFLTPCVSALLVMRRIKDVYRALCRMRRHSRR